MLAHRRILWTAQDLAQATEGTALVHTPVTGVSIDSRTLEPGDLFVALEGPLHNGHDHVAKALEGGASLALVSDSIFFKDMPVVVVDDTLEALKKMAHAARNRSQASITAVTGSFGKTSSREALKLVLSSQGQTHATEKSFNNHWGVPLTLARLPQEAQYGVFEVGMNHAGEIANLVEMVRPHVALITTISDAHIENLGSREAICDAKCEIFQGMLPGDKAILNQDDDQFERAYAHARSRGLDVISFGLRGGDFKALKIEQDPHELRLWASTPEGEIQVLLPVVGTHWASNALGIMAAAWAQGVKVHAAAEALRDMRLLPGRGERHMVHLPQGEVLVIDESYNAGPASMEAALKTLAQIPLPNGGRRVAVLGDMLELGDRSQDEHQAVGTLCNDLGIDGVYTCGPRMKGCFDVLDLPRRLGHGDEVTDILGPFLQEVRPGDVIMIKGSRGQRAYKGRMAAFVDALLACGQGTPTEKV